jgi:hypothetical protein
MSVKAALCGAVGLLCATAPGSKRVESAALHYSAELPADWAAEAPDKDVYKPTAKGSILSTLDVLLLDEGDAALFVKTAANPSKELRTAQKIKEFKAKPVEKRGAWLVVETYRKTQSGEVEFSLHAARPGKDGYYGATFWAETEQGFKKNRPVFERWLDTFTPEK